MHHRGLSLLEKQLQNKVIVELSGDTIYYKCLFTTMLGRFAETKSFVEKIEEFVEKTVKEQDLV